jgi:hypothetical protein
MNAKYPWENHSMKQTFLQLAAAAVFVAGCSVDATKFTCANSTECPSGYHCDIGTATAAGSFKCANGAAPQKTITANASKFFLVKRPSSDGTVRTTISADLGAVTSTPDFVGVRVVASQGNTDLADSRVGADGSVLAFQLPQPLAQVSLRVQDDSGHSVPVTGYNQRVELGFEGREVPGTANTSAAFDVTTQNDALFPPAAWIASGPGPGPGGKAQEFTIANTLDGGVVVASDSYTSIAYPDYATASTTSPPIPTFGSFAPPVAGSPVAWQPVIALATSAPDAGPPPARVGAGIAPNSNGGFYLFGGAADATATPSDPQGSFYSWTSQGWAFTPAPATQLPSARSGAALGRDTAGGSCYLNGFVTPCDIDNYQLVVAGGQGPTGVMSNEIQLFDRKLSYTNFSLPPTETQLWRLVGLLPFANAGMQSAAGSVPFNAVVSGGNQSQIYAGGMMIYGRAITTANSGTQGCMLFGAAPQSPGSTASPVPIQPNFASCVGSPSAFDAITGPIGFRQGATLIADPGTNPTTFYLFGGRKAAGATTALQNDIWKATITCPGAPAVCTPTTTWTQVSGGGVGANFPTPRAGAGGALWSSCPYTSCTPVSGGRLVIHGGADASGTQNDLWEWDFGAIAWRQVTTDQTAGVLTPPARLGFAMTGDLGQQQIFAIGGAVAGGALTDQMWLTARESAAKLLVKVPFSLPAIDQAKNLRLTVDALGTSGEQVFLWDGTTWRYFGSTDFSSSVSHITASPTAPATSFLQPDGNIYLLFMQTNRIQFSYASFNFRSPVAMDRLKITVDFQ